MVGYLMLIIWRKLKYDKKNTDLEKAKYAMYKLISHSVFQVMIIFM